MNLALQCVLLLGVMLVVKAEYMAPGTQVVVEFMVLGADQPDPSSCDVEAQLLGLPSGTDIGGFPLDKVTRATGYCSGANDVVMFGNAVHFGNCVNQDYDFRVCWTLTSGQLQMAVQHPTDDGWVAVSFTQGGTAPMIGSHAIIGSRTPADSWVGEVSLMGQNTDGSDVVSSDTLGLTDAQVDIAAGMTTLMFTRPAAFLGASHTINLAFATGPSPTFHGAAQPTFSKHTAKIFGSFNVDTSELITPVSSSDAYRTAHAVLMTVAWALMLPCGMIAARFFKREGDDAVSPKWLMAHRACQVAGLCVATAAFVIALVVIGTKNYLLHRTIGIVVMSMGYFQPFNAVLRPEWVANAPQQSLKRRLWELLHKNNGRATILLATFQLYVGLNVLQPGVVYVALVSILVAAWALAFIGLELRQRCRGGKKPGKKQNDMEQELARMPHEGVEGVPDRISPSSADTQTHTSTDVPVVAS